MLVPPPAPCCIAMARGPAPGQPFISPTIKAWWHAGEKRDAQAHTICGLLGGIGDEHTGCGEGRRRSQVAHRLPCRAPRAIRGRFSCPRSQMAGQAGGLERRPRGARPAGPLATLILPCGAAKIARVGLPGGSSFPRPQRRGARCKARARLQLSSCAPKDRAGAPRTASAGAPPLLEHIGPPNSALLHARP